MGGKGGWGREDDNEEGIEEIAEHLSTHGEKRSGDRIFFLMVSTNSSSHAMTKQKG